MKSIDLSYLHSISNGDRDFFIEVITLFVKSVPAHLASIQRALTSEEYQAVENSAHRFKAATASLGLSRLTEMLNAIEAAARTRQRRAMLPKLLAALVRECEIVIAQLRCELNCELAE